MIAHNSSVGKAHMLLVPTSNVLPREVSINQNFQEI
jgi:hypothetical protein